jgi:sucrose phosphorylase
LFGSRSDTDAVIRTGQNRSINRAKLDADALLEELRTPDSLRARVYGRLKALLTVRTQQAAFHPLAAMHIHDLHPSLFVVARESRDGTQRIMALHNVSGQSVTVDLSGFGTRWHDLISGETHNASLTVAPYQVLWLTQ